MIRINVPITWTCHVCGKRRPDDKIAVLHRDMSARLKLAPGTAHENIRHCNDTQACIDGAKTFSFFKQASQLKQGG